MATHGARHGRPHTSENVLNESWPPHPRTVRDSELQYRVLARVVGAESGIEQLEGRATRWRGRHVYVDYLGIGPRRAGCTGLWLDTADIHRLPEPPRYVRHVALTRRPDDGIPLLEPS